MNILQPRSVALAVALAFTGVAIPAMAQQAPTPAQQPNTPATAQPAPPEAQLEAITVTGIRASEEAALRAKREADSVIDVITSQDIGKMPDKNVADSLAHISGVTMSSAGANEGGFDENDRVSMRGTNPSLTQTLVNGHNIASGDWFVLDQTGTIGRSVSYTLLPSEIVSKVIVHKSSEASLVEGGVAGSVDIITRAPLEFTKPITLELSGGAVYADLPAKTDPQFNGIFNWKNDANNVGVMVQGFYEQRHLRRDGQELLGYNTLSGYTGANAVLNGVYYPGYIGSVLFEQERKRYGGLVDVEFKPTNDLTLDLNLFDSTLNATNYNRNYILWLTHFVPLVTPATGPASVQINPGYTIANGTLTSASWAQVAGQPNQSFGVYDQISRPDESADSRFLSLSAKFRASNDLHFSGQGGISKGDGKTPQQNVLETNPGVGSGGGYTLNGMGSAASWNLGATNNSSPYPGGVPVAFGWIFGDQNIDVKDSENWLQLDGDYSLHSGVLTDVLFGVRISEHGRSSQGVIGQGPNGLASAAPYPSGFQNYPSNFGDGLGGSFPRNVWYFSPDQLAAYDALYTNRNPVSREDWNSEFSLHETDTAAYGQVNFEGQGWSGNAGLRLVQTKERALVNAGSGIGTSAFANPGSITTSAFGPFLPTAHDHTYTDILPSANFKLDLTPDMLARFAASETMTRPDYSALAGPLALTPGTVTTAGSGTGSNPDLKPIRSTNLDAGVEWYFAKRSLLSATAFFMDLHDYVSYQTLNESIYSFTSTYPTGQALPYLITIPVNASARVDGVELNYEQAITKNFGANVNFTLANGHQTSNLTNGDARMVGTSKDTYNIGGYFENEWVSARINYTYRSAFYSGLDRGSAFTQDNFGTLGASVGVNITKELSVNLDGLNLNNPELKYYALNESQPRAFYMNGRQYYLTLRYKF